MNRPNILVICIDQWQARLKLPDEVRMPAMERLAAQGVTFNNHYCTVPICTPSRATMWTGRHAKEVGIADNTNFAWGHDLATDIRTIGHMMREQGYYTAFKGKWHVSQLPAKEGALEPYGFSDYQQWGEVFGAPLEGIQLDGAVTFEALDWLEHRRSELTQPWLLAYNIINPHDIMYYQTDPVERPHPNGMLAGLQTTEQTLGWFQERWNVELPRNFEDKLEFQPEGVRHYKQFMADNYGKIPDDRADLWLNRTNYYINAMRKADDEILHLLEGLDRHRLWENTIVVFTGDHGEMNGAHQLVQKGAIPFEEAAVVNLTVCMPGGQRGKTSNAVGSHLDLAPTFLEFAGLSEDDIRRKYPELKGHSLKHVWSDPRQAGPRGSVGAPGVGTLYCWDGLHELDNDWATSGALGELTVMQGPPPEATPQERMRQVGQRFGAPDFSKRNFFRAATDGRYKLVRWFSPEEYGNPATVDELYATSDVALYDLSADRGELENIGHPDHPDYDPALVQHMLDKLHSLVEREIGDDRAPFDLEMFGTRDIKYARGERHTHARRDEADSRPDIHP